MYISKSEIKLILSKINILNIISLFVKLKKVNINFFALCPFHNEKTPSFVVNEFKQRYYCFGCRKTGNAINFIMEFKKIGFIPAVKYILTKENLKLKEENLENLESEITDVKILKKICVTYKYILNKNIKTNKDLKEFLNSRGLDEEILNKFQIGYAEDDWNFISDKVKNDKKLEKKLIELGILIKGEKKVYDRFRNRIIFPIRNHYGYVVGFGARALKDEKPKYINSPESFIFLKKNELYGFYESSIEEKMPYIIIVEGYTDVLTSHKNKITNVVAVLGSSFGTEHYNKIKKEYKKIIFCFDGDEAGMKAALRTAYIFMTKINETFIGFVFLPKNEDPDSYINKFGKENFLKLVEKPIYILDFIFNHISSGFDLNIFHNKVFVLNNINNILKNIKDENLKNLIMEYFKGKIGIGKKKL